MDRTTVYPGQLPAENDILLSGQRAMVGLARIAESLLGTTGAVDSFTCTPTSPTASMSVVIGPGTVYQAGQIEASQWSSQPVDTHTVIKQGIALDPTTLTLVPPTTPGYAQNVLIQVRYQDVDDKPTLLPFYNPASTPTNPLPPLQGPGGNGQALPTVRRGAVAILAKYGTATNSGLQITPNPDPGWLGTFVVTLAFGQTAVTAASIAKYAYAPFITAKLLDIPGAVQNGVWTYAVDSGTSGSAIVANLTPAPTNVGDNFRVSVKLAHDLVPDGTLNVSGFIGPYLRASGNSILVGDFRAGDIVDFVNNLGTWYITNTSAALADIETSITKTIGGTNPDFIDLNVAMAWISRRRIKASGFLTFQCAAGKFIYNSADINVSHPDAARMAILGATPGSIPPPSSLAYTGNTPTARANDTASNLATLRAVYATEIALTGGRRFYGFGGLFNIQDILFTGDGTAGSDVVLLRNGEYRITRIACVGAGFRSLCCASSYVYVFGTNYGMGAGSSAVSCEQGAIMAVQTGAVLAGFSSGAYGLNSIGGGLIGCADLNTPTLYARGNGDTGILGNLGSIVASSISISRDNGKVGWAAINTSSFNAQNTQAFGNPIGWQAGQLAYMYAPYTTGSSTNVAFNAFGGGFVNPFGSTATGTNGFASPSAGGAASTDGGRVLAAS